MTPAVRLKLLAITGVAATAISACSSHHPHADATGQVAASPDSTTSASISSPTTSTPAPPTSAPPSSISSVTASAPGSSGGQGLPTCATNQLHLTVRRGASASQQAFATLILTNSGSACGTAGFPGVSLLLAGRQIGPAAARLNTTYAQINLSTGASAHARFTISTACNAERSDSVRVYPPDQTTTLTAPLAVFACSSTIGPLEPGVS